ncbi:MAG: chemotaxis-specific protein-glutamate methyltransferase CheB [Zetaproteobacteria bacterium]|nr:chemotaxis-specific protein-glutamate methyltransferase CheB [Zetaproteobacteria bacterium]
MYPSFNHEKKVRVILVDDSLVALAMFKKILADAPSIEVVGVASNGQDGLLLVERFHPQVICTDYHMPIMDGLEFTRQVMARFPTPILALSISFQPDQTHKIFKMLEAGAVDVMAKPLAGINKFGCDESKELVRKIMILAGVHVIPLRKFTHISPPVVEALRQEPTIYPYSTSIIAMGASTGGPQAIFEILKKIPADFPVPIVCVQHISEGFIDGMIAWLNHLCSVCVCAAKEGETPQAGHVYFPRDGQHLTLDRKGAFAYENLPPVSGHKPSISVTFSSLRDYYHQGVTGVLLTGMGRDGVDGLRDIFAAGGMTIAQNQMSSVVFGMPKVAIEEGVVRLVLSIETIGERLIALVKGEHVASS